MFGMILLVGVVVLAIYLLIKYTKKKGGKK